MGQFFSSILDKGKNFISSLFSPATTTKPSSTTGNNIGSWFTSQPQQNYLTNYISGGQLPSEKKIIDQSRTTNNTTNTSQNNGLGNFYGSSTTSSIGGQTQSVTADTIISAAADNFKKMVDDFEARGQEFDIRNPFVFDEVLQQKKTEVSSRLDPYYNKILDDYISGINVKRSRSLEDEKRILADTTQDMDTFTGRQKRLTQEAILASNEGMADSNLFFSGKRLKSSGDISVKSGESLQDFLSTKERGTRDLKLQTQRNLQDYDLSSRLKKEEVTREKTYQTEAQALKEANLARLTRDFEKSQYVGSPFSGNAMNQFATSFSSMV